MGATLIKKSRYSINYRSNGISGKQMQGIEATTNQPGDWNNVSMEHTTGWSKG
jgi:hypothetical protein